MLSTQLRSEYADISEILSDNIEHIKDLYNQCLEKCFDKVEVEESHICFCTIVAIALLNDELDIQFPIAYMGEDEALLCEIVNNIDLMLCLETMVEKNMMQRKTVDGRICYFDNERDIDE